MTPIDEYIASQNADPKTFIWTKSAQYPVEFHSRQGANSFPTVRNIAMEIFMDQLKKGYLLAIVDVHNADAFKEYMARVPALIAEFGGRFVVRGFDYELMEGSPNDRKRVVILEFGSSEIAKRFYHSPGYQLLAEIRYVSCSTVLYILNEYVETPVALTEL